LLVFLVNIILNNYTNDHVTAYVQKNTGQGGGKPGLDLNVERAWALGVTGKNVTTAIMDDGVDYMHPDLYEHFVSCLGEFILSGDYLGNFGFWEFIT